VTLVALAVVVAVVAGAAAVQTLTGFGFALIAVPLLSFAIDTKAAVVVAATLGLVASTWQAINERAQRDDATVVRMLLGSALGAPLGLVVLQVTPERALRAILAVTIVGFVVIGARRTVHSMRAGRADIAFGAFSGVLSTSLSTNGPPLVMALHTRGLEPAAFRATLATVFCGAGLLAAVLFAATGRYDEDVLSTIGISLPALAVGFIAGRMLRSRIDPLGFRRLVVVLLVVTAGVSALAALRG
jgi:uncharacterized protein